MEINVSHTSDLSMCFADKSRALSHNDMQTNENLCFDEKLVSIKERQVKKLQKKVCTYCIGQLRCP